MIDDDQESNQSILGYNELPRPRPPRPPRSLPRPLPRPLLPRPLPGGGVFVSANTSGIEMVFASIGNTGFVVLV